jgi:hypothetical protein
MISWFYAYVEHIEIKTKTVNIIHNFERHHNNLSCVNNLMTTVKIERAFIHLRSHIHLDIIHMK